MHRPGAVVIGETPSLGRAIAELLETDGVRTHYLEAQRDGALVRALAPTHPVIVVACNASFCQTVRQWLAGEFLSVPLVAVGTRDPVGRDVPGIHPLGLPLDPSELLRVVRGLLEPATPTSQPLARAPADRPGVPDGPQGRAPGRLVRPIGLGADEPWPVPSEGLRRILS
jgi:hypothetical protein